MSDSKKSIRFNILIVFSVVILKVLLDLTYIKAIVPVFGYQGFLININYIKLVESYVLLLIFAFILSKRNERISGFVVSMLILTSYIPTLTVYAMMDWPRMFLYAMTIFWLFVVLLINKTPEIKVSKNKFSPKIGKYFLVAFWITTVVVLLKNFGFSINLSLSGLKIYFLRSQYNSTVSTLSYYLFDWTAYIVNPFLFSFSLIKRKKAIFLLVIILQILLFSITGLKSYLFVLPFILAILLIFKTKEPVFTASWIISGLIFIGLMTFLFTGDYSINSLFTRRVLLVPANLSFYYYDFFSTQNPLLLSGYRIFGFFTKYPYNLTPPRIIGEIYFPKLVENANNGIISDAYVNLRYFGMALWAVLLAVYLKIIDSLSENKFIALGTIGVSIYILNNSAFLTSLLTHGLLVGILVLYLYYSSVGKSGVAKDRQS